MWTTSHPDDRFRPFKLFFCEFAHFCLSCAFITSALLKMKVKMGYLANAHHVSIVLKMKSSTKVAESIDWPSISWISFIKAVKFRFICFSKFKSLAPYVSQFRWDFLSLFHVGFKDKKATSLFKKSSWQKTLSQWSKFLNGVCSWAQVYLPRVDTITMFFWSLF